MFRKLKATWTALKNHEPGTRFEMVHREQQGKPVWVKVVFLGLALVAFAIGVVLAFIPGPAVVFFALSGALLSTQSRWVARTLDKGEVWGRKALASIRAWWRRKRHGTPQKTRHAN